MVEKKTILLTGSTGVLGTALINANTDFDFLTPNRKEKLPL